MLITLSHKRGWRLTAVISEADTEIAVKIFVFKIQTTLNFNILSYEPLAYIFLSIQLNENFMRDGEL